MGILDNMPSDAVKVFTGIGLIFCVVTLMIIIALIFSSIHDAIRHSKWKHQYKRRFDKPPLAKCYCKDCEHHNWNSDVCHAHEGWHTADDWFCWAATPRPFYKELDRRSRFPDEEKL